MAKPISKIAVRCPHCAAEQSEPEQAKSTFCRRCSQYFAITPAVLASAPPPGKITPLVSKPRPSHPDPEAEPADKPAGGFFSRFDGLLGGGSPPRHRQAHCFECTSSHEVPGDARSTTCKACGAYIDLQDYKITSSFSRNIRTRGAVYLSPKGDLSSSKIACSEATLHGRMRGNLYCDGLVTIRSQGRLTGTIEAGELVIEKGSDVQFSRPVKAASVAVHGAVSGHVHSGSQVFISKSGSLEGNVTATGFTVEKGGIFQGELTITPRQAAAPAAEAGRPASAPPERLAFLPGGEPGLAHG